MPCTPPHGFPCTIPPLCAPMISVPHLRQQTPGVGRRWRDDVGGGSGWNDWREWGVEMVWDEIGAGEGGAGYLRPPCPPPAHSGGILHPVPPHPPAKRLDSPSAPSKRERERGGD